MHSFIHKISVNEKKNFKVLHIDYKPELKATQKKYYYRIDSVN